MLQRDLLRARRSGSSNTPYASCTPPNASVDSRRSRPTSVQSRPASVSTPLRGLNVNQQHQPRPPKLSTLSNGSSRVTPIVSGGTFPSPSTPGMMDETVRVAVRCRPPNPVHSERNDDVIVSMDPTKREIYLLDQETKPWRVDNPLWSCSSPAVDGSAPLSQAGVYERIGRPILLHALDGYNSTLMAYGQTGSGKTYTMMGGVEGQATTSEADQGVIPRICQDLFAELDNRSFTAMSGETISWEVHVRYVEVYCERISDLLNNSATVNIREEVTPRAATFALVGARRIKATAKSDLLQALTIGNRCRKTAATRSNERSSRSHAIFIIELTEMLSFVEPEDGTIVSAPSKSLYLRLVDLAGSERVSETGVQGQQLKEAKDINLSLFTLGQVIECLTDSKRRNIRPPYRDSVLTKILRDAFGGNSKTTMICTIAPCESSRQQTIQTLGYAAKARRVLNKPRVEEDPSAVELRRANEELLNLRRELAEAQRTGKQHEEIQEQLRDANERLRREQLEARRRRESMEQREAELASRLQTLETQREEYEAQMAALEEEAEQARAQQRAREDELRSAHQIAEDGAARRLTELQEQREQSEQALQEKEQALLKRQRDAEEKLRELETNSHLRVEELLQQQHDLEEALRQKERFASAQEREMRRKQKSAEDAAQQLEEQARAMEEEWAAQIKSLEADAKRREEEVSHRARDAQERLRTTEEEYRRKEEEMRRKWTEAEEQSRRMQAEMEGRQTELDKRVLELNRQAHERESELSDKLQRAEFELHKRERESQLHQEELQALKQAAARQSESHRTRERTIEEQHSLLADTMRKREELLKARESDLQAQFDQVMAMKLEWERQHSDKTTQLQCEHEEAITTLKKRELTLHDQESDLRRQLEELRSKLRSQEMELKRKEMELLAQRNDFSTQTQREHHANLRQKEELQHVLDRAEADNKLREERLQRWEDDLKARRATLEKNTAARLQELQKRESSLASMGDTIAARHMELEQRSTKLQAEAEAMHVRAAAEEESRARQHQQAMAALQRKETDLNTRFNSMNSIEEAVRSKSRAVEGKGQAIEVARRAVFQQEVFNFFSFETLWRNGLIAEEESELRFLDKCRRLEQREVASQRQAAAVAQHARNVEARARVASEESRVAKAEALELREELTRLRQELKQRGEEAVELKVQLGTATSSVRFAEEALRAAQLDAGEREAEMEVALQEAQTNLARVAHRCDDADRRFAQLAMAYQLLICDFEEQQRSLIEHHSTQEGSMIMLLEMSDRKLLEKGKAMRKWQALYQQRCEQDSALDSEHRRGTVEEEARRISSHNCMDDELRRREEGLFAEQAALRERISDFEARERAREDELTRQEAKIKTYVLELEGSDRAATKALNDREARLVEMGVRLREKEAYLASNMRMQQQSVMAHGAEETSRLVVHRELWEEEGVERLTRMKEDRELALRGFNGDPASLADLLRRQEEALIAEAEKLQRRVREADEDEARVKRRLAEEEARIRDYLIALEAEDVRRHELSQQGQAYMREAEGRLAQAKKREEELQEMARTLQAEALTHEEQSRLLESNLQRQERKQQKMMRERRADLDRRKVEADSAAKANERTLTELDTDLRSIINKNKEAEQAIKSRDAALKRQKAYYMDLSKMLEERNRMLQQEHAHRMDGKKSATWLTGDLLDVNDILKKELATLKHRYGVLIAENKVECEHCGWHNARGTAVCRCCNSADIAVYS